MKKMFFIWAVLIINFFACSQTPPKSVLENFALKFPDVIKVKWAMEEENEWEAEFKFNGHNMSASFDNNGKWIETEKEIKTEDLPVTIAGTIKNKFNIYSVKECSAIENPELKGFEIVLAYHKNIKTVIFNSDGTVVKEESSAGEK